MGLREGLGRHIRETRLTLDISQRELAGAVGISRSYLTRVEAGEANVTLEMAERLASALGLDVELSSRPPVLVEPRRQRDLIHARCSAYVARRIVAAGWSTAREIELVHGRSHGWIDILAYHARIGVLIVIEVKTRLDDLGAIERQLAWYERGAHGIARRRGWRRVQRIDAWLLALASEEVDRTILLNRELLDLAFPLRATGMLALLDSGLRPRQQRGLGLIDPSSKRRSWIVKTRADGRRSSASYLGYADAARRMGG